MTRTNTRGAATELPRLERITALFNWRLPNLPLYPELPLASFRTDDLHGRLTDCLADGFAQSMLISCHSLVRMAKLAESPMEPGGSITTVSFYGAEKWSTTTASWVL